MRALKQFVFLVFAASATLVLQTQTTRTQAQYSSGTCAINWPASGSESDGCATGTCTSFRLNSGNPLPTCQNLCSQPAPYGCCSGYDLPETNGCGNAGQYCTGNLTTQVYVYKVCKCTGVCGGGDSGGGGSGGGGGECDGYYDGGYCSPEFQQCCGPAEI